jgi:hypothetical protein
MEKIFRNEPIRTKNCLWWPCLLTDRDEMSNVYREPSRDASNREIDCGKIMRCRDCILNFVVDRNEMSWRNVFLSSTMINKMLDK